MLSFFKECWILGFQLKVWAPRVCSHVSTLAELEFQCFAAVCSFWYLFSSQARTSDSTMLHGVSPWLMCSSVLRQGWLTNSHEGFWDTPFCIVAFFLASCPINSSPLQYSRTRISASQFSETIMLGSGSTSVWYCWESVPGRKLERPWFTPHVLLAVSYLKRVELRIVSNFTDITWGELVWYQLLHRG